MTSGIATDVQGRLISAIYADSLCAESRALGAAAPAAEAFKTCLAIGSELEAHASELIAALEAEGIQAKVGGLPLAQGRQSHRFELLLTSAGEAKLAAQVLRSKAYVSKLNGGEAAWEVHSRLASRATLSRPGASTFIADLVWPAPRGWLTRLPRVFHPNVNDYDLRDLPRALWPLYLVLRPFRLAAEALGLRAKLPERVGPFLSTPDSLIEPLLEFAEVTSDDVVVDIGCGDGRLVIEAARRRGCRARGVENNTSLVRRARGEVLEHELTERVDIVDGDGSTHPIDDASIVFLVLPGSVGADFVKRLLARMPSGATLIAHHQSEIPAATPPEESAPLFGSGAVTVAHRWTKP